MIFKSQPKDLSTPIALILGTVLSVGLTVLVGYLAQAADDPEVAAPRSNILQTEAPNQAIGGSVHQPEDLFFIRAQNAAGPLVVYAMPGGREQFKLPPGMPSADWQHYFAAAVEQDRTILKSFDPESGNLEHSFSLDGRQALSGVSPTGRWAALTRITGDQERAVWTQAQHWQTDIQLVESATGRVAHSLQLEGNFEVETISASGDALFLIEHRPALNPTHYLVRLYDLAAKRLQPDALRAKTATDEVMTGLAWGGLATPDGRWLLTLYLNTSRNVAFIHALNLEDKFPFCIDLPSGDGDMANLKNYALTLAPEGRRLYAANAALGVVAEISLDTLNVIRMVEFSAPARPATANQIEAGLPTNYSVVSQDGRMLYFSSGWNVWGYNTASAEVSGPYLSEVQIRGLGLSGDEQQLYVAIEGQTPRALDVSQDIPVSAVP